MQKTAGFCRHIEKDWLEQTLRWVASGASLTDLNSNIESLLTHTISTKENRRKARNLLTSIWARPSDLRLVSFFDAGLDLHTKADAFMLSIHWGMLIARKPFFAEVARFIGRQLRLNDMFTFGQVSRRMSLLYGETETTRRALSAVLRTMIELGVLKRNEKSATYQVISNNQLVSADIASWLINAVFISDSIESRDLYEVLNDQVWFPFTLSITPNNLDCSFFEQHQQGNTIILFKKRETR